MLHEHNEKFFDEAHMADVQARRRSAAADWVADPVSAQMASAVSPVSWSAVFAGAAAAASFGLILLALGTGLGLATLSPWMSAEHNAHVFGFAAIIWICVTQILTCGIGGYMAGRLRGRWFAIHTDETHFRDTAHGFLVWAISTLVTAGLLAGAASGFLRESTQAAASAAGAAAPVVASLDPGRGNAYTAENTWPVGYLIDGLFRLPADAASQPAAPGFAMSEKAEVARIFLNSLGAGAALSNEDATYVSQLVARRTGVSVETARARVDTTYTRLQQKTQQIKDAAAQKARDVAEEARKATVHASLWLFVSMLMGAFSASLAATWGGRERDA